jgi:hypothetical protein
MGMELIFRKIVDGNKLEVIDVKPINYLRDSYPQLVQIISHNCTMHDDNDVWICPSTNFMYIYKEFEEFYNKNYSDKNTLKLELIEAINNDVDVDELTNLFESYTTAKNGIFESYLVRIKEIMRILKEYSNKNAYLYLSY